MSKVTKNTCRVCLTNNGSVSIFENSIDDELISDIIIGCTNLKISQNDGYLENICSSCIENLNIAFKFIKKCIDSDQKLKELLTEDLFLLFKSEFTSYDECRSELTASNDTLIYIEENKDNSDIDIKENTNEDNQLIIHHEENDEIKEEIHFNHLVTSPFNCDVCCKNFSHKSSLIAHKKRFDISKVDCKICAKTLCSIKSLQYHMKIHSNTTTNKKNIIIDENSIDIDLVNTKTNLKCDICSKYFINRTSLSLHKTKEHQRNKKCNVCKKMFYTETSLKRHLNEQHNLKCIKCGVIFNDTIEFNNHSITHKNNSLQCDICLKTFESQKLIQSHYQISHLKVINSFICEVCGQDFDQNYKLNNHHKKVHLGLKSYKCDLCPKSYAYHGLLYEHKLIHLNLKPFQCTFCDKSFSMHSSLHSHLKYHTGNMKYECSFCKKKFLNPSKLKVHLRTHTGETPYECKECGKKFTYSGVLKMHLNMHAGIKPYKCRTCEKRFIDKQHLRKHEIIHTDAKPYECNLCYYKCNQAANLKTHMKVHLTFKDKTITKNKLNVEILKTS